MVWQCVLEFIHSMSTHANDPFCNAFGLSDYRICVHTKTLLPKVTLFTAVTSTKCSHHTWWQPSAHLKLGFICVAYCCLAHRLSSKANSFPLMSIMAFNCIKDNKDIKDCTEIFWMCKSTAWSSACVVVSRLFYRCYVLLSTIFFNLVLKIEISDSRAIFNYYFFC